MGALLGFVYLICARTGCGLACIAISYLSLRLYSGFNQVTSLQAKIAICAALAAFPAAAQLAGAIVDRGLKPSSNEALLRRLAVVASLAIALSGPGIVVLFRELALFLSEPSLRSGAALGAKITGAVIFCGGVSGAVVILLGLLIELPLRWIAGERGSGLDGAFSSIRLAAVLLGVSTAFYLLTDFGGRMLLPSSWS